MMLALVTMTGQAQVKSSLDLCLRDEATGEWLIGLFDDGNHGVGSTDHF